MAGAHEVAVAVEQGQPRVQDVDHFDLRLLVDATAIDVGLHGGFSFFVPGSRANRAQAEKGKRTKLPPTGWARSAVHAAAKAVRRELADQATRTPVPNGSATGSVAHFADAAHALLQPSVMQPFRDWLKPQRLAIRQHALLAVPCSVDLKIAMKAGGKPEPTALECLHVDLSRLVLYKLIYTEAANLRHTPEVLLFLFFVYLVSSDLAPVLGRRTDDELRSHYRKLVSFRQDTIDRLGVLSDAKIPAGSGLLELATRLHTELRAAQATEGAAREALERAEVAQREAQEKEAAARLAQVAAAQVASRPRHVPRPSLGGASTSTAMQSDTEAAEITPGPSSSESSRASSPLNTPSPQPGSAELDRLAAAVEAAAEAAHVATGNYARFLQAVVLQDTAVAAVRELVNTSIADFTWQGSGLGSTFLTKIVQPMFSLLVEQVSMLGQNKYHAREAAQRAAQDDLTESMSNPDTVAAAVGVLGCDTRAGPVSVAASGDAAGDVESGGNPQRQSVFGELLQRLMAVGSGGEAARQYVPAELLSMGPGSPPLPGCASLCGAEELLSHRLGDMMAAGEGQTEVAADLRLELDLVRRCMVGRSFWTAVASRKTFTEHRSVTMPLVSFDRTFTFLVCVFATLCAAAWTGSHDRTRWLAAVVPLHWALVLLTWTLRAVLSAGPPVSLLSYTAHDGSQVNATDPNYKSNACSTASAAAARRGVQLAATAASVISWALVMGFVASCWVSWAVLTFVAFRPGSKLFKVYAVVYAVVLLVYELGWRQSTPGGYVRKSLADWLIPASSGGSPMFPVAAHLRTDWRRLLGNALLWAVALGIMGALDWFVLVRPARPRMQAILAADWTVGADLDLLLAAMQLILLFLLSLVVAGVSYSVATSLWGCLQGIRQHIGAVRNFGQLRAGYNRIQNDMADRLLKPNGIGLAEKTGLGKWEKRQDIASLVASMWNAIVTSLGNRDLLSGKERKNLLCTPVTTFRPKQVLQDCRDALNPNAREAAPQQPPQAAEAAAPVPSSAGGTPTPAGTTPGRSPTPYPARTQPASQTSSPPPARTPPCTYLPPIAIYVAQVPQLVSGWYASAQQLEMLQEAYAYLLTLLAAIGAVNRDGATGPAVSREACEARAARRLARLDKQAQGQLRAGSPEPGLNLGALLPEKLKTIPSSPGTWSGLKARKELLEAVKHLLVTLVAAVKVYSEPGAQLKDQDDAVEALGWALHSLAAALHKVVPSGHAPFLVLGSAVQLRHFVSDPVLEAMHAGLQALVGTTAGPARPAHLPSCEDFLAVAKWLTAILAPTDEGTTPSSTEALSLLTDFASGLSNPDMPNAPTVAAMLSVTTLIPHFKEAVVFALSSRDACNVINRDRGAKCDAKQALPEDEVLFIVDDASNPMPSKLLQYLASEFKAELDNLLERCAASVKPLPPGAKGYQLADFCRGGRLYEHRAQLLLWASFRGQVLARTVDGMAMYRTALALQAVTDALLTADTLTADGRPGAGPSVAGGGVLPMTSVEQVAAVRKALTNPEITSAEELADVLCGLVPGLRDLLDAKYGTVVASQVFAELDASKNLGDSWRAHGIRLLLTRYSACLQVSYLEEVEAFTVSNELDYKFAVKHNDSVFVRAVPLDQHESLHAEGLTATKRRELRTQLWRGRDYLLGLKTADVEVLYRIRQPVNVSGDGGSVILGEGKPENQNVALPYCTGHLVQTIDMNQDNTLAQAFKLRNLTLEFKPVDYSPAQHVAVVGYPEWVFSYRCGLAAELAAQTERIFGTQIQRVMAFPSGVRSHYGHPDLWNKIFCASRGGVSKANAVQHVAEDAFGGFNAIKRGGLSKYVSYTSVGKGRDMGLDSILGFEGKISKGAAEQAISRDIRFLATNFDFFRSLSLYFTSVGHFIGTWITIFTIQAGLWVQLLLLLGGASSGDSGIASAVGAIQILQLGTLPLLCSLFALWVEMGLSAALWSLFQQLVSGGIFFHIIRSVTSSFHFGRAMLFGGASYVATGRGLSLDRRSFTEVYSGYGRSHMFLGLDVLVMSVLILIVSDNGYSAAPISALALWSSFLVVVALLIGPFWFTPHYFNMRLVIDDIKEFGSWTIKDGGARGVKSWEAWHTEFMAPLRNDLGAQVFGYRVGSIVCLLLPRFVMCVLGFLVAVTAATFDTPSIPDPVWVIGGSILTWAALLLWAVAKRLYTGSGLMARWRWFKAVVQVVSASLVFLVLLATLILPQRGIRFAGVLITLWANYLVASFVVQAVTLLFPKQPLLRSLVDGAYRQADVLVGLVLSVVLVVLTFIGQIGLIMVDKVQATVQFNGVYATSGPLVVPPLGQELLVQPVAEGGAGGQVAAVPVPAAGAGGGAGGQVVVVAVPAA
ncbi:hypothetical protein HYH03_012244 [Edaphochlamys debaryana]|uniref:Glycosyl transferase 48 domain-containing protein n=1 Tax=Edaphochlamys debaryana TaxID=47281 RepID=A0A836BUN5_9CHLO|nr:hypothetical protein HYH03_012244 [Edaphochlamys debaryana]|eukprot:KAG2489222.1 hypothetical protein HYH03_012244 [Edaphochlamys debaryana]